MFTTHFGMTTHPFSEKISAADMLRDERVEQGLSRLTYLVHDGLIGLVTGGTGVGKSCLVKLFLDSLAPSRFQQVYVHLTHVKASSVLKLIVAGLGEQPRQRGKERLFLQIFEKARATDRTTVLVLDEAHLLSCEALTDLRLLVSSAMDDANIKIVLAGQEPLLDQLRRSCLLDLAGRISVRYHIRAFTEEQTSCYMDFRMKKSGSSEKVFEPEAKELIHNYTSGVPRHINSMATACLISAATQNRQKINDAAVNEVLSEFKLP